MGGLLGWGAKGYVDPHSNYWGGGGGGGLPPWPPPLLTPMLQVYYIHALFIDKYFFYSKLFMFSHGDSMMLESFYVKRTHKCLLNHI